MAKVRDGISKRKLIIYLVGISILEIFSCLIALVLPGCFLLGIPILAVGITVVVLYLWSASGGAYRAFMTSYTGNSERGRFLQICDEVLIYLFLFFTLNEEWSLSTARAMGMILKTLRPSFRQMHRWNRSLEDLHYSEAKVDYRGRMRI